MQIKTVHIRLFRKLGLLKRMKLKSNVQLGNRHFHIPITKGLGLANLYVKQDWMGKLIEAMKLAEKDVFVDVGVNLGQTLLQLRSVNSQTAYLGFEPNATCCSYVEELVRLNRLDNSTVKNLALSDSRALVDFEFDSEADPRASINLQQRPNYFSQRSQVQTAVFDEEFKGEAAIIKIDVEGAELAVLKGMKRQLQEHQPLIICEVLDSHGEEQLDFTQKQADELTGLLHNVGYKIIQLQQDEKGEKLLSFRQIEGFEINVWERSSMQTNDYLFYQPEKLPHLPEILKNLIHA